MTNPDFDEESCANEQQNDEQKNVENTETQDNEQNVEKHPLDAYVNTGVYIEEEKEYGDLLIVLGDDYLPEHLRQFYLSSDHDKIFTRILAQTTWSSWFVVQSEVCSEPTLDFNEKKSAALMKLEKIETYENAPEGFLETHKNSTGLLICLSLEEQQHTMQFLIAETRRHFWIRHYTDKSWSSWESFL